MEDIIRRVQAIRECGHVERAHSTPHHGSYSNAAHSWQLAVLIILLHPAPSARLIMAALFHDIPERLSRCVNTILQPASVIPEPRGNFWRRYV